MGLILCLLAAAGAVHLTSRQLGSGLGWVLVVGCIYGWLRCFFNNPATHFTFDAALLGFYLVAFTRRSPNTVARASPLMAWALVLGALPVLVILTSPFVEGQPLAIQLVGLRSFLLFLPILAIVPRLANEDIERLSDWALAAILVATAFAAGELALGIELFFPMNAVSASIYRAADATAASDVRIPACFNSSHGYGGTCVGLIPLLMLRLERGRRYRWLTQVSLACAASAAFICSARIPVLLLASVALVGLYVGRARRRVLVMVGVGALGLATLTPRAERFQRYETLADEGMVETRIGNSFNRGLLEIITENPLGRGLASGVGTSIPYFLVDEALPQEGIESEFSRLALELGLLGLIGWAAFIAWTLFGGFRKLNRFGGVTDALMWTVCTGSWLTAFVGTGVTSAIPGTLVLFLYMGLVASQRPGRESRSAAHSFVPVRDV